MKDFSSALVNELERLLEAFLVPLRMGDPLDPSKYQAVRGCLRSLRGVFADADAIPKPLVRLLVDLYPQLHGITGVRREDEGVLMEWAEDLLQEASALLD